MTRYFKEQQLPITNSRPITTKTITLPIIEPQEQTLLKVKPRQVDQTFVCSKVLGSEDDSVDDHLSSYLFMKPQPPIIDLIISVDRDLTTTTTYHGVVPKNSTNEDFDVKKVFVLVDIDNLILQKNLKTGVVS